MRGILAVLVVCLMALLPVAGNAQPATPGPAPAATAMSMDHGKVIAIGLGAVLGAVVLGAPGFMHGATILGAVVGGALGAWWYNGEHGGAPAPTMR